MITQFEVTNFRCIESLSLAHLGRINLITGKNGAGKTSLLEALWLLSGSDTPVLGLRADSFRGLRFLPSRGLFRNLFFGFDPALTIKMFSEGDKAYVPRRLEIWLRNRPVAEEVPFNGNDPLGVEQLTSSRPGSEQEILFRSHLQGDR